MKKKLFNLMGFLLVLMAIVGISVSPPAWAQSKVVLVGGSSPYKNLTDFVTLDQALNLGTGKTYYVDSGLSASGLGTSWTSAVITVDEAINKCTASNGDVIMVAPGHAESFSAANGFDLDVAGVTIYMLGEGANAPTFTFADTDATIAIGAANCKIVGGRYLAGISEVVTGISIEAGGDDVTLNGLIFPEPTTSTFEFDKAIVLASGSDRVTIENCISYSCDATGATDWLDVTAGVVNGLNVIGNYVHGEYANAPIYSDQINLECLVKDNIVQNMTTGQFGIEFSGATTGSYSGNLVYTDGGTTAIDPGSMKAVGPNWIVTAIDKSPVMFPAQDDTAENLIGVDDNNNSAATTNVAANQDGSILERLEQLQEAVNNGTGTSIGENKSIVDLLGTTGTALVDDALSVVGILGVNDNDNAFTSATVAANRDGSILERLEFLVKYFETGTAGGLTAPADTRSLLDILGSDGTTTTGALAGSLLGAIGTNEAAADTAFTSATVEDDADGSVLERLEHVQVDTDKIDGATLAVSPVAGSIGRFIASGGTALGTQLADSKSLVDAIGTNGTTVADTATGVAGMIGIDDADNAMATTSVVANKDGSVFERLEALAQSSLISSKSPNYLAVTADFLTASGWETVASHEIATVTGMVEMIIIPQCTETLTDAADAARMQLGIAGSTASIIAETIPADAGGIATNEFWVDATPADVVVTKTAMNAMDVVVGGGIDVGYEITGAAMTDGTIIFHIFWWPLDATGSVTAGDGTGL